MSSLNPIIFWGAKGQAKVLRDCVELLGFSLVAVFDNAKDLSSPFLDVPLFLGRDGFIDFCNKHKSQFEQLAGVAAIGGARGNDRREIHAMFHASGIVTPKLIHPLAHVAESAVIHSGTQVLALAHVGSHADVGADCIVNNSAVVEHECILRSGVHIGPNATLTGEVVVGQSAFIGAGAVVLPRLTIGANAIIGAGAVVTRDVPDNMIVYGNPARIMRRNQ